jgi:DNA ligase-1
MIDLFNQIAKYNSPGMKLELLREYPYQEELKSVLRLALDPFITFGVTDFDPAPEDAYSSMGHFEVLEKLSTRELTGGDARRALGLSVRDLDEEYHELVRRIVRKDLRCGIGPALVETFCPGLIRSFEVMRAVPLNKVKPKQGKPYIIEPKYDGLRAIAVIKGQSVTVLSRNGLEFTSVDHLKEPLLKLAKGKDLFYDGELINGNFNSSSSAVRRKNQTNSDTQFYLFDRLEADEWGSTTREQGHRSMLLARDFESYKGDELQLVPSYRATPEEFMRYYNLFLDKGHEGAMVKDPMGHYRFKKHKDWIKIKPVNDVDLTVESLVQGEGKYVGMLGAAIVKYRGKRVNVGTGFSDEEREQFWKDPSLIKGRIIEIQYHEETPDGSLRHPRFVRVREDKAQPDS